MRGAVPPLLNMTTRHGS